MNPRKIPLAPALLLAVLATTAPVLAQEPPPDSALPAVRQELADLNETVKRIEGLLQLYLEGQKLDLVLKRIDVTTGRIADAERELERQRSSRDAMESEVLGMRRNLEEAAEQIAGGEVGGNEAEARRALESGEAHVAHLEEQIGDLDAHLAMLENRLTAMRTELVDWQAYFDREVLDR